MCIAQMFLDTLGKLAKITTHPTLKQKNKMQSFSEPNIEKSILILIQLLSS